MLQKTDLTKLATPTIAKGEQLDHCPSCESHHNESTKETPAYGVIGLITECRDKEFVVGMENFGGV